MYSEIVTHQAARVPDAVAVSLPRRQISYAVFEADINRVSRALADFALSPGRRIAVGGTGYPYYHWLVVLALDRLGHVSCSFSRPSEVVLVAPDAVVAFQAGEVATAARLIVLDEEWWKTVLKSVAQPPIRGPATFGDPARILLSSGTTGTPKKILLSQEVVIKRVRTMVSGEMFFEEQRSHVAMGVGTAGGFLGPLRTWSMGGTAILGAVDVQRLIDDRVTGLFLSPAQLTVLLDQLSPRSSPLPLLIRVIGSALARRLSVQTRLHLASELMLGYGSTESGVVARGPAAMRDDDETVAGVIIPWVEVEAVDASGTPLPPGETGELRVRSYEMVDGYLEDPEASSAAFRDGWFYPGDVGSVSETRVLRLTGRVSEVINIGGQKLLPNLVEERVAACPGVKDAAAFSVTVQGTGEQMWIAVVTEAGFSMAPIQEACRALGVVRANVIQTREIPRNDMGKIDRQALRDLAARAQKADSI